MLDDTDSMAIARRAYELGLPLQTYDPAQLVSDVMDHLRGRGLDPELPEGTGRVGMAAGAAGQLLRAFGILPAREYRPGVNDPDNW